jgi:hypothetical protein
MFRGVAVRFMSVKGLQASGLNSAKQWAPGWYMASFFDLYQSFHETNKVIRSGN